MHWLQLEMLLNIQLPGCCQTSTNRRENLPLTHYHANNRRVVPQLLRSNCASYFLPPAALGGFFAKNLRRLSSSHLTSSLLSPGPAHLISE